MIYVASPYSHPDFALMTQRYEHVRDWTFARIKAKQESLFSPIAYCHEYAKLHGMPKDAAFWHEFNLGFIRNCTMMYVLMMDGWEKSKGVTAEIDLALELEKPIKYYSFTVVTQTLKAFE